MLSPDERAELTKRLREVQGYVQANNFDDFDRAHDRFQYLLGRWSTERNDEPQRTDTRNGSVHPSYCELSASAAQAHDELTALQSQLAERDAAIAALQAKLADSEAELVNLKNSQPSLLGQLFKRGN